MVYAGREPMRTIRVTGRGNIKVKPDMTRLTLQLEGTYPEYSDALRHSSEDTERLKDALEPLGFARTDLKTLSFDIDAKYENYRDKKGNYKQRFAGYQFEHEMKLEFLSDNDRLGKTLYALAHSSVNPEIRISYTVKDREGAKNELLGRAVTDAREKAEVLTKAAGVTLKEIQSIDYSWGEVHFDFETRPVRDALMIAEGAAPTERSRSLDIEPDDIEVSDIVTVVWEIA